MNGIGDACDICKAALEMPRLDAFRPDCQHCCARSIACVVLPAEDTQTVAEIAEQWNLHELYGAGWKYGLDLVMAWHKVMRAKAAQGIAVDAVPPSRA